MSAKRYVKVLEPTLLLQVDGEPALDQDGKQVLCTFPAFIRGRTTDPAFLRGGTLNMAMIVAGETVRRAFALAPPGQYVVLDESDWELLRDATINGTYAHYAASVIHFMRSIRDAPPEDPTQNEGQPNGS